jgi:hypothetical protein
MTFKMTVYISYFNKLSEKSNFLSLDNLKITLNVSFYRFKILPLKAIEIVKLLIQKNVFALMIQMRNPIFFIH